MSGSSRLCAGRKGNAASSDEQTFPQAPISGTVASERFSGVRGRGGTGRHTGLKILRGKPHPGSTPGVRTSPGISARCRRPANDRVPDCAFCYLESEAMHRDSGGGANDQSGPGFWAGSLRVHRNPGSPAESGRSDPRNEPSGCPVRFRGIVCQLATGTGEPTLRRSRSCSPMPFRVPNRLRQQGLRQVRSERSACP
jgi:hypothetical protein